jgi:hypothetical protein
MTIPINNYILSNDCMMINWGRIWKEVSMAYFKVPTWNWFGGTTKKKPQKILVRIVSVPVKMDSS